MTNNSSIYRLTFVGLLFALTAFSQTPSPSPTDERFSVTASTEIGARWVDVNGAENKFRSDLNYRRGFRLFDSSIYVEDKGDGGKAFDSAMFQGSGWGADPSGMFRANVEKNGMYRFDANVRRVGFFNNLNNHAIGATRINYHNYDTRRNFGDLDLTILPENPNFRFRIGGGYNLQSGTYTITSRSSDAFPVTAFADADAYDFRAGADGKLLGFNLSGTYGFRSFRNRTDYRLLQPDEGDQINTRDIDAMERLYPIDGRTHYGVFSLQRTFAERFDITAKILHSKTSSEFDWTEFVLYRDPVSRREDYDISGETSRPQTRADLGMTLRVTDKFRLSNTFTYDGFNINGGSNFLSVTTSTSRRIFYLVTRYRRYSHTVDGDYQFNDRFGVNVGYRYTHRKVRLLYVPTVLAGSGLTGDDESAENSTNTFLAGTRIKPRKNWVIYADIERGKADNVFTRAGNSDFTNFRIRNRMSFSKFAANVSFLSKNNEIPGEPTTGTIPRITDTKSRTFSATLDWYPIDEVSLSGGYNYLHLTSEAFIRLRLAPGLVEGFSQYFVRDNYFFIDVTAKPHKRLSIFGSYRWNKDCGHGDRAIPALDSTTILGSYPIDFKTPEIRAAIRLNRYVDWNIGYQYYDYKEDPPQQTIYGLPAQNYSAHMPYTSVRIYLGRGKSDR
jgi:hypothetical protein